MSEQQTPRPEEDAPTADAVESVAVTESGPAPAATQDGPEEPVSGTTDAAAPAEQDRPPAEQTDSTAAVPAAATEAPTESEAPATQAEVPSESEAPAAQTEAATDSTGAPAAQTEAATDSTGAPAAQTEAATDSTGAPAAQAEVPADATGAPATQAEVPADATEAPATQAEVPADATGAPAAQAEVPSESEAPAAQTEAATDATGASAAQAEVPTETEAPATQTEDATDATGAPATQTEAAIEATGSPAAQAEVPTESEAPATQTEVPADATGAPAAQAEVPTETEAPATQGEVPTPQAGTPAAGAQPEPTVEGTQTGESATVEPGGTIETQAAQPPTPTSIPKPSSLPKPSALPRRGPSTPAPTPAVVAPVLDDSREAAAAAAWGRVDPDGTVWVREAAGERTVGQYTGADTEEALAFYVRRFLDLQAQVVLFETRLPQLQTKEIDQTLSTLTEALAEPAAVGDIDGLRERLATLRDRAKERRKELSAQREAAKAQALAERTAIVERAEAISATDPAKVHWRSSGEELRSLLEQWKNAQRSGPRLDRPTEDALWKRFSRARTTFDRNRGHFFSQLDSAQAEAKRAKEQLIAEAEALSTSTDWGRTSASYRDLMDRWKAVGRASRKEDDALWARFRAARQRFFEAREAQNAEIDAEYAANLEVKLELLKQAEAILPVTDPEAAKAALRPIQDRWDQAGKVPRADVQRVEARMRAVEQAVREADQERWSRSDPEKKARAEGAAAQLYESIDALERQLADARSAGDARAEKEAADALEARKAWLDQVLRAAGS
ncbi:DUF349 domain-containing protein [Georgenia sp. H159]|uniref:DUF349 domain-containing protein n=1 Tax=Georgenia sp. H159 TaxID=3076115 RepID=UPI002D78FFA2|nr:DUF349 domain-containing protein [Georgenia sp. H159]